jgi:hypothetical protein
MAYLSAGYADALTPVEPSLSEWNELQMHQSNLLDFVNVSGFGYVNDRRHVAGFQSHRFSKQPEPVELWKLQTLNLVGLVMYDKPVAYVSDNLPRMDELREAPTRSLDPFELRGLAALRGGEDLFARQTPDGLRMLGALRCAQQCADCHGATRGHLLGAFSYTFARGEP